jgi:hypothetical protein
MKDKTNKFIYRYVHLLYCKQRSLLHVSTIFRVVFFEDWGDPGVGGRIILRWIFRK